MIALLIMLSRFSNDINPFSTCQRSSQPGIRAQGSPFSSGSLALLSGEGGFSQFRLLAFGHLGTFYSPSLFATTFFTPLQLFWQEAYPYLWVELLRSWAPTGFASCLFHDTRVPALRETIFTSGSEFIQRTTTV
jgi:hypothetical protein